MLFIFLYIFLRRYMNCAPLPSLRTTHFALRIIYKQPLHTIIISTASLSVKREISKLFQKVITNGICMSFGYAGGWGLENRWQLAVGGGQ